jgi:hypothetical protein
MGPARSAFYIIIECGEMVVKACQTGETLRDAETFP